MLDFLLGAPLASEEDQRERIGPAAGIPVFGLDALSSAAYGPEAALTLLLPLGVLGLDFIVPISTVIIVLLSIVYFSYMQTIAAYPSGGGSYTVSSHNLGALAGLLAAAALMIDYVLNVAVGISAGVGALISAVPKLQPHTVSICLAILVALSLVNLRGVREAGLVFMLPTYLFVACLSIVLAVGFGKFLLQGGHPAAVVPPPMLSPRSSAVTAWLLLKAFASGCTAMTGVEAVSNGVGAFREPRVKAARVTLTVIITILIVLLAGIAHLVRAFHIGATSPGQAGYQSVLSQLTEAVTGRGWFYFVTMLSILIVLALSANTSFADFPRLCRAVAENRYLPYPFTFRGRRLTYSYGIYVLVLLSGVLLVGFRGVTDRLIPLFAVGAFLAFTLSQAGMVVHWKRKGGPHARFSMVINGVGAIATGGALATILIAKFSEGAWVTVLLIPTLMLLMFSIRRHYDSILRETSDPEPAQLKDIPPPLVVVPLDRWSRVGEKALRFAYSVSGEVFVLHIRTAQEETPGIPDLAEVWQNYVDRPAQQSGLKPPVLVIVDSPYRFLVTPIYEYVLDLERRYPDRHVAVLVPELVERRWIYYLLHSQRATALKLILYRKGNGRIIVINVPWYLRC
ncbi:MAG: APC family permease [Acidobacteria bacterium]|nr:APC family permease [Acidobacteriota bacterium]